MREGLAHSRDGVTGAGEPLAHSAREPGAKPQTYREHLAGTSASEGVIAGARRRAASMLEWYGDGARRTAILNAVADAAIFHDLGKLDPELQAAFRRGRNAKLGWDHVDAGVAHLRGAGAYMAAWLVRAHHAPGLPSMPVHFTRSTDRHLRGRRRDDLAPEEHAGQIARTDGLLGDMLAEHERLVGSCPPTRGKALHGLAMRLALSCLVDADHADTAYADRGWTPPNEPAPRWSERLDALDAYVARLGRGGRARDDQRRRFYEACRAREPDQSMVTCEGPVGIGKTTAVLGYLLRRAIATAARRVFVVAPYTAILSQTAERLREALLLEGERAHQDSVVAEHHHRADFANISSRDLATLWTAPVILTTAVQFFETLAANTPSALRKLHSLPGSVVFLDEAHAALPVQLWPQNWLWLCELAEGWGCSFALASGSLSRFWEIEDVVGDAPPRLLDLAPPDLGHELRRAEATRVSYRTLKHLAGPAALAEAVAAAPGPRLLVMNTVQSAAVMATTMRRAGNHVLHLSTALCPRHRDLVLAMVKARLAHRAFADWTLVATSLMEAGLDLSFRTPFRERFATASLIQIGGRGNRNAEWPEGSTVYDFTVSQEGGLTAHPAAAVPADVLSTLFDRGDLDRDLDPAEIVTRALRLELKRRRAIGENELLVAERNHSYPCTARYGQVIDSKTELVVVDAALRDRIATGESVPARELLAGSVRIWTEKIERLRLDRVSGRDEVFWWPHAYDPAFLGYMEGALSFDV